MLFLSFHFSIYLWHTGLFESISQETCASRPASSLNFESLCSTDPGSETGCVRGIAQKTSYPSFPRFPEVCPAAGPIALRLSVSAPLEIPLQYNNFTLCPCLLLRVAKRNGCERPLCTLCKTPLEAVSVMVCIVSYIRPT